MKLLERIWVTATCILEWLSPSNVDEYANHQTPIGDGLNLGHHPHGSIRPIPATSTSARQPGPTFKPPTGRIGGLPGSEFQCEYPEMVDYEFCSTDQDRGCWLRNKINHTEYNIYTDYETVTPIGIDRYYIFNTTDFNITADGQVDTHGKAFQLVHPDGTADKPIFPGPWLQACWGDTIHVLVGNTMKDNGTSIHWHGIRQLNSMPMDGVNGVTQCPIPPNNTFEYVFEAKQYGSSWYHSHYSVQYADGLQGPITLHGPSSSSYDEAFYPTIMTDWGHNSAFYTLTSNDNDFGNATILLNGTGDVRDFTYSNTSIVKRKYQLNFHQPTNGRAKRYLLRLINTSFDTMFTFTIDNHILQVISADFVPIVPYHSRMINIAIGQRYNIIVEADQYNNSETNFWIRTWANQACGDAVGPVPSAYPGYVNYARTGIVRYDMTSTTDPVSRPWAYSPVCADEPYDSLIPVFPWHVGSVVNGDQQGEQINVTGGKAAADYATAFFSLTKEFPDAATPYSFQINYSNPTFLDMVTDGPWSPNAVVIPEDYTEHDWMYLVLMNEGPKIQHPIHLHGHDFGILYVSPPKATFDPSTFAMSCSENTLLKCDNPPRRDVVTLPSQGFVIIAFKTDNPGAWLMHCHIAFHASAGLALQILERLPDSNTLWPTTGPAWTKASELCNAWETYWGANIEDDSGI